MKLIIMAAIAVATATGAFAQDGQAGSHNPAIKNSDVHTVGSPAMGHSSFTERQAQGRIAEAGFTHVGDLTKTDAGIWQGHAIRHGRPVMVMLDYKGNVSAH
jgi:hypothetical protein